MISLESLRLFILFDPLISAEFQSVATRFLPRDMWGNKHAQDFNFGCSGSRGDVRRASVRQRRTAGDANGPTVRYPTYQIRSHDACADGLHPILPALRGRMPDENHVSWRSGPAHSRTSGRPQ